MFENRVLRKLFGSKKEEVAQYWKQLHTKSSRFGLLVEYHSVNQIMENEVGNACRIYICGKEGKYSL